MAIENLPAASSTEYAISKTHSRDSGNKQLPCSSADGKTSCQVVNVHDAVEELVVTWTAKRWGGPPVVPSPYSLNSGNTFLRGTRSVAAPMLDSENKGHYWGMSGVYYYALNPPQDLNSAITAGKMPFDPVAVADTVIPAGTFQTGLLDTKPVLLSPLLGP